MRISAAGLQDWAIGIDRRTGSLKVLGVLLVVVLLAAVATVFALFSGVFTKYDPISVALPANSTAVLPGSAVQYRDVKIGKVVGRPEAQPDGSVVVQAQIDPGRLAAVPASVHGVVNPISIFGNQYVVLEAPDGATSTPSLASGTRVPAKATAPATSVQQTVTSLDRLLVALKPAELNAALTAVAQALQGQGKDLGETADVASTYLATLQPLWPTIVQDLGLLAPVAQQLADSSPDIIGILGNSLTSARTVNEQPLLVDRIITGSSAFADQAEQLNSAIEQPFSLLAAASGPFLDAVSANPTTISRLLEGLDEFAKSVTQAGGAGPYLKVSATVDVKNPADLAKAALGGTDSDVLAGLAGGLGADMIDPPTYTSGDRPSFPDRSDSSGRTSPAQSAAVPAGVVPAGLVQRASVVPALDADSERAAVLDVASAVGGVPPASSDIAALLLSPLLSSLGQPR